MKWPVVLDLVNTCFFDFLKCRLAVGVVCCWLFRLYSCVLHVKTSLILQVDNNTTTLVQVSEPFRAISACSSFGPYKNISYLLTERTIKKAQPDHTPWIQSSSPTADQPLCCAAISLGTELDCCSALWGFEGSS